MTRNRENAVSTKLRRIALELSQLAFPITGGLFDEAQARYWRALSIGRESGVVLGLFFTVGGLAFFIDLISWQRLPVWALLIYAALFGGAGVVLFLTMRVRELKFVPALAILTALLAFSGKWLPHGPEVAVAAAVRSRIALDATGLLATSLLGYRLFLRFMGSEGMKQVRIQTELEFAQAIQQTLVPPVATRPIASRCTASVCRAKR